MANLTDADKVLRNDTGKDIASKLDAIKTAIQNQSTTLNNLSDVSILSVQDGQFLKYNSTEQKWENVSLPDPMVFKGTLGTGGTITDLPIDGSANVGDTYKVIEDGTYATVSAKVGDLFSCLTKTSVANTWVLIPSGDESFTDTWRGIKVNGTEKLASSISSGEVDFVEGSNVQITFDTTGNKIIISATDTTYSEATQSTSGLMSASDKTKLDTIPTTADTQPVTSGSSVNTKEYIDDKTTLVKSASGSLIHITDGGDNIPMKSLESEIVAVQSGSGTPSPSNPRAISGFDSGVVSVYEKYHRIISSTLTPQIQSGITVTPFADGHFEISGTATANITLYFNIPTFTIFGDDTRTLNFNNDVVSPSIVIGFMKNSTLIDSWSLNVLNRTHTNFTALANQECNMLSVSIGNGLTVSGSFKVEFLVTNSGNTYTFTFGQTVYGGHFDNKGNLVVTHGEYTLNGTETFNITGDGKIIYTDALKDLAKMGTTVNIGELTAICESFDNHPDGVSFRTGNYDNTFCLGSSYLGATARLAFRCSSWSSTQDAQDYFALNNTKIIYELATPITLTITSQDIPTLSGENNIFSNCGDTDIEYFTSSADEVVDLIKASTWTEITGTLTAGNTSITLSSGAITSNSTINVFTDGGVDYTSITVTNGSVTLTFEESSSDLGVKVRVS